MDKIISDEWYNPETGFISADKLYRKLIKEGHKVTRKEVKVFIEKQETHQLMRKTKKQKTYNTVVAGAVNNIWQMDCIIYDRFEFNHYKYILCVIDINSRRASCKALTNMKIENIIESMDEIIKDFGHKPKNITCDNQFNNKEFINWAKKENITMFFTDPNEINKNAVVERFNYTVARRLQAWRTSSGRHDWYKVLNSIVKNYNNTYHSGIKAVPQEAYDGKDFNKKIIIKNESDFKINDKIRILRKKKVFDKGDELRYSRDVYKIIEKVKNKYKLENINTKEELKTLYKSYELKKINEIQTIEKDKLQIIEHKATQKKRRKVKRIKKEGLDTTNILTTKRKAK